MTEAVELPGRTLSAPAMQAEEVRVVPSDPPAEEAQSASPVAVVKGQIEVEDEVVEKVAALAALEVDGVADLGGDLERAIEGVRDRIGIGAKRGNQGASARIENRQVSVKVIIVIEYGYVVMDVAREVKANVARAVSRMLGLRVIEVSVTVDDVNMPAQRAGLGEHDQEHGPVPAISVDAGRAPGAPHNP